MIDTGNEISEFIDDFSTPSSATIRILKDLGVSEEKLKTLVFINDLLSGDLLKSSIADGAQSVLDLIESGWNADKPLPGLTGEEYNGIVEDAVAEGNRQAEAEEDDVAEEPAPPPDDELSIGSSDILSSKALTNQTGKVDNYVSDTPGEAAAYADFYAMTPVNVRTYATGTVVGDLADGRTINIHPSSSLNGTITNYHRDL